MRYDNIHKGKFLSRPNRFIANVEIDGKAEVCHVKNTGRCRELLIPGTPVFVQMHGQENRRTACSLITVDRGGELINMDSQAPNKAAGEWLQKGNLPGVPSLLRPETVFGESRFDFYAERATGQGTERHFIEVKGVTLEENGVARFPDAPTKRGEKHIRELIRAQTMGYRAQILFVVQMACAVQMEPNGATDPAFARALREAAENGVRVRAVTCRITPDSMEILREIPVVLP